MKKLVILSIALLFVVVGMAGMAQAAGEAKATLSGKVTLSGFTYACKNAKVTTTSQYFTGTRNTLADGTYEWKNVLIPCGTGDINGYVMANWFLSMFGVKINFKTDPANGVFFSFSDPIPFTDNYETANISLVYSHVG